MITLRWCTIFFVITETKKKKSCTYAIYFKSLCIFLLSNSSTNNIRKKRLNLSYKFA